MGFRKSIVQFVTTLAAIGFGQHDSGSCIDEACAAPQARISEERWWESAAMQNFRSPNVMPIGTLDFNKTVTHFRSHSLLIAFYDPRSKSFRELQPIIEDTADALAKMTEPIGYFGAVDVTVHSYLAHHEAPQLETVWQDPYKGPFRFKRPRFYPMIILRYRDGVAKEYKGVVKKKNLLEFLKREMVPKGALQNNTEDLQELFRTPGPFVLACGFEGEPQEEAKLTGVLQATANLLSGEMIFAQANLNLCSSLRADLTSPSVLYIRKSAASTAPPVSASIQSSTSVLLNQEAFVEWLNLQRPVLLKEITPDNSWVFLERREALVIFLVDSKDAAEKKSGEAIFSEIEVHLEAKYFQLAWANCVEFSEEFGITQCPAFLVVDTAAEDLSQPPYLTGQELMQPTKANRKAAWSNATSAAERLRLWLEQRTVAIRKRIDGEENKQSSKDDGKKKRSDEHVEEIVWANDWYIHVLNVLTKRKIKLSQEGTRFHVVDAVGQRLPLQESLKLRNLQDSNRFPLKFYFQEEEIDDAEPDSSEDFLNDWEDICEGTSTEAAYEIYQAILMHMTLLRQSFQDVYGDYLPFDFSSIDRVQELHKHMRLLVSTTEDVEEVLRNKSYRLSVWKSMEKRLSFLENLEDLEPEPKGSGKGTISRSQQTRVFRHALIEGSGLLREVFSDLGVAVVCRKQRTMDKHGVVMV